MMDGMDAFAHRNDLTAPVASSHASVDANFIPMGNIS